VRTEGVVYVSVSSDWPPIVFSKSASYTAYGSLFPDGILPRARETCGDRGEHTITAVRRPTEIHITNNATMARARTKHPNERRKHHPRPFTGQREPSRFSRTPFGPDAFVSQTPRYRNTGPVRLTGNQLSSSHRRHGVSIIPRRVRARPSIYRLCIAVVVSVVRVTTARAVLNDTRMYTARLP